jgi:hypothetical protein
VQCSGRPRGHHRNYRSNKIQRKINENFFASLISGSVNTDGTWNVNSGNGNKNLGKDFFGNEIFENGSKNFEDKKFGNGNNKFGNKNFVEQNFEVDNNDLSTAYHTTAPLGAVVDCGATDHVFRRVFRKTRCRVPLQGAHGTQMVYEKGIVGILTQVLQNQHSPADLVSLQGLFRDGPWDRFEFTPADIFGIRPGGVRDKIATLTNGLYTCTKYMLHLLSGGACALLAQIGSSVDTHEADPAHDIMRMYGLCAPEMMRIALKHGVIEDLDKYIEAADIKSYARRSHEARQRGSQTGPRYVRNKDTEPKFRVTTYLQELFGDSKQLRYPGPNGEKWMFTMVDRFSGTSWTVPHRDFTSLPALVCKKLNAILYEAKRDSLTASDTPRIGCFFLDGHPTQVERMSGDMAPLQKMLELEYKIHVPRVPPGDHARMGLIERLHRTLDRIAVTIFHNQGRSLPNEHFMYAYNHASKIKDLWPQRSKKNFRSSFQLRTSRRPTMRDIPYPSLYATGYTKNLDKKGQGYDSVGVVVDTGQRRKKSGHQLMLVWIPKTNEYVWRSGVVINQAFSTFGDDRIARMRSGNSDRVGVVHSYTDRPTRVHTRTLVHEASKVKLKKLPVPNMHGKFYLHATRHGVPIARPYLCADSGCKNHLAGDGFKTLRGLKRHITIKAKNLAKKLQAIEDQKKLLKLEKQQQQRLQKEMKRKRTARKKRWRSPRHGQYHALFTQTLEEYMNEVERDLPPRVVDKKPWLTKRRAQTTARLRKEAELKAMQNALSPPPDGDGTDLTMHDFVQSEAENYMMRAYKGIPYEKDSAPNLSVDNDFTSLRCLLAMKGAEEDSQDLIVYQRHPGDDGIPDRDDYAAKSFVASAKRIILTEENAHRYTPTNIAELRRSPFYSKWKAAMETEIAALNAYRTWRFVNLDKKFKRITLRWVYKIKFEDGILNKFKARLVARGFTQRPGLDYDPNGISAPVARASTFKTVLAHGAKHKHYFGSFDVKSAYLLAALDYDVYARLPYGVVPDKGANSLKLLKSLYGLKQAGFNWNKKFTATLQTVGFRQSDIDPCLFIYKKGTDVIYVVLWVDDGMVSTNNKALWHKIERKIHGITPLGSELGHDLDWLLGMKIFYNRMTGILRISQKSKINSLLERYGMQECNPQPLPMPTHEKLRSDGPQTPSEKRKVADLARKTSAGRIVVYDDLIKYCREIIGSVGYLACWGRPDVRQAVYYLARYQINPSLRHFQLVKHLMRYLQGTKDLTLTFGRRNYHDDGNVCPLACMVDSNYIGDGDSCYSTTGYVFLLYGCPILCESKKQTAVSNNTSEAELIAASHAVRTGTYLRRLLIADFEMDETQPTLIGEDNQGCIHISRGGGNYARLRHIRVADSYIYQAIMIHKTHSMRYVRSADNISDIFTKPTDITTFRKLRWCLMGDAPNDEDTMHPQDVTATYHWLSEDLDDAPAEECWRSGG